MFNPTKIEIKNLHRTTRHIRFKNFALYNKLRKAKFSLSNFSYAPLLKNFGYAETLYAIQKIFFFFIRNFDRLFKKGNKFVFYLL